MDGILADDFVLVTGNGAVYTKASDKSRSVERLLLLWGTWFQSTFGVPASAR